MGCRRGWSRQQSRHRTPCWYHQVKTWGRIIGCEVVRLSLSCIARKSSPKKYHRRFRPSHPLLRVLESTHSLRIFYGIGYEDRPRVAWRESWSAFQRGFGINSICLLERTRPGKYSCINWDDPCSTRCRRKTCDCRHWKSRFIESEIRWTRDHRMLSWLHLWIVGEVPQILWYNPQAEGHTDTENVLDEIWHGETQIDMVRV